MENQKYEYLMKVKEKYPSTIVLAYDKISGKRWAESKEIKDCNDAEFNEINLLRVLPNQIILDIENKDNLLEIENKLIEKGWGYQIWDTGSRGYHIYIEFDNLDILESGVRQLIRKYIISFFNADLSVGKDAQFVACPYAPHFKTTKPKTLLKDAYKLNTIHEDVIKIAQEENEALNKIKQNVTDDKFKDYLQDPFLNYVLTKQIKEGDRNNIVFKNLAIGLVKAGLDREDIVKIASRIVNNCPGKMLSEFMGWVDKALNGELNEYNKVEINRWAEKNNHPIPYIIDSVEEAESLQYNDIKTLWKIIWNSKIACQDIWSKLALFNLLGTVLDERIEDYRLHVVFSSPSGSGKDEGVNLIHEVLTKMGYSAHKPASMTDRTLVGAVNAVAIEYNTKNRDKIEDGRATEKEEVEMGLLSTANWIAFPESETVFRPGMYNKQLHVLLRQAMDKSRTIEKGVTGRLIDLKTNTTFIFTTYTMSETIYKLLDNGLFQRGIYYNKILSDDEHDIIVGKMFEKNIIDTAKQNLYFMDKLIERLKVMKTWYEANKNNIVYFKTASDYQKQLWAEYKKDYEVLERYDKDNLNSMLRRGVNVMDRLLKLNSICQMKTNITKEDVDEMFTLYKLCMDSVKKVIQSQNSDVKKEKSILRILSAGSLSTMRVYERMETELGIKGHNTKRKWVDKLVSTSKISEVQNGNVKLLVLTDTGKDIIEYDMLQ